MPYPVQWQRELDALKAPVTIRWQDASGQDEFIFTGSPDNQRSGIIMLAGATGLGIAPTDQVVTDYPALDGGFLQGGRFASREIMLPLYVWGRTRQEFLRLMNALAATMRPDVPRRLVVEDRTFPRLRTRYAECYYSSGWEGDESYDASGRTWAKLGITLAAPDPWFHEPTAETFTVSSSKPTVTVPELLGGSAWPTIRVSMPYGSSNMRITNVTSGQQIRIDLWAMAWELIDGDMSTVVDADGNGSPTAVEIVTAPRQRTVRVNEAIAWDVWDLTSNWINVRTGDVLRVEIDDGAGFTGQITIQPDHKRGV